MFSGTSLPFSEMRSVAECFCGGDLGGASNVPRGAKVGLKARRNPGDDEAILAKRYTSSALLVFSVTRILSSTHDIPPACIPGEIDKAHINANVHVCIHGIRNMPLSPRKYPTASP